MKALMDCVEGEFQAVRDTQLVEDVMQVILHRLLTDKHLLRHFFIFVALSDQSHDLTFPLAQRGPIAHPDALAEVAALMMFPRLWISEPKNERTQFKYADIKNKQKPPLIAEREWGRKELEEYSNTD